MSIATGIVNNRLIHGCFDFDVNSGRIFFRIANSFVDSELSEDVCTYILGCAVQTIDTYHNEFLSLSNGTLTIEKFIETISE